MATGGSSADGLSAPGPSVALLDALADFAARQQQAWLRLLRRASE